MLAFLPLSCRHWASSSFWRRRRLLNWLSRSILSSLRGSGGLGSRAPSIIGTASRRDPTTKGCLFIRASQALSIWLPEKASLPVLIYEDWLRRIEKTTALRGNLAAEHAIDKHEVSKRKSHAKAPPDQTIRKGIRSGSSVIDSDIQRRIGGGDQQVRIDRCCGAYEHEDQVSAGSEKGAFILITTAMKVHDDEAQADGGGDEKQNGIFAIVCESVGPDRNRRTQADEGPKDQYRQEQSGNAAGPQVEIARRFPRDVMCAVDRQGNQRDYARNHGVPVQNSRLGAGAPVGPERQEEIIFFIQWHATNHIAQSRAVKDGEQNTG